MTPEVTVILPVYNGREFLRQAVDSMLAQSFRDFEILVIDDASTDDSVAIVSGYDDPRIRLFRNERNLGLIETLNIAIGLSRGSYIARMDQDDVSLPDRLQVQVAYLKTHPHTGVIATPVIGITPGGSLRDQWPADAATKTYDQIKKVLPFENCIAHPGIMARAELMRKYRYSKDQMGSEDWDLWLRMVRDGIRIEKTEKPLLYYRVHPASSTISANLKRSPQLRTARTKWVFFTSSLASGKMNRFVFRSFFSIARDLGYFAKRHWAPAVGRKLKWFFLINPALAAADLTWLRSLQPARHFFFFSYSHMGGAEKVHAAIVKLLDDRLPVVLFTGLNDRGGHAAEFGDDSRVRNISAGLYHPLFSRKVRSEIENKIRQVEQPVVFGSNSSYFYELVRRLPPMVRAIDLVHDITYDRGYVAAAQLAAYLRMDNRVFVSSRALEVTKQMYENNFVDPSHFEKMRLFHNYIRVGNAADERAWEPPFNVLYVGRDSPEKRVHIVLELAETLDPGQFRFTLAGAIKKQRRTASRATFTGEIIDRDLLSALYRKAHFVIITSASEGFPLSLMEGMAAGCIPVATAVGDIPRHIRSGENGFLLTGGSEKEVIEAARKLFGELSNYDLKKLSENARKYCLQTFGYERFRENYLSLLNR